MNPGSMGRAASLFGQRRPVLNGYDILAKSIPGMALLLGASTFLPNYDFATIGGSVLANFAIFLTLIILLGLFIGEAVHTFAETIEKIAFIPVRWLRYTLKLIYVKMVNNTGISANASLGSQTKEEETTDENNDQTENEETTEECNGESSADGSRTGDQAPVIDVEALKMNMWNYILSSCHQLMWILNRAFKQHRTLLADIIKSNYNNFLGHWEENKRDELFKNFKNEVEEIYEIDIQDEPEKLRFIYPNLMSTIYVSDAILSKRYQVIYAFCRSMWMSSLLITVGYVYVIVTGGGTKVMIPGIPSYEAIFLSGIVGVNHVTLLPVITGMITIGFLAACGKYKYHFVEYIISDFPVVVGNSEMDRLQGGKQEVSNQ
ncbi:MAG: hypothetical protein ACOCYZ_00170 [Halococcoides sp.]